jgi:hypothetical protein
MNRSKNINVAQLHTLIVTAPSILALLIVSGWTISHPLLTVSTFVLAEISATVAQERRQRIPGSTASCKFSPHRFSVVFNAVHKAAVSHFYEHIASTFLPFAGCAAALCRAP